MRRCLPLTAFAVVALSGPAFAQAVREPLPPQTPVHVMSGSRVDYAALLASPLRPEEDRARDVARQTAITLDFTGVQPGWKVADMIIGGGYFTRAFAAVVGPEGHVTAW